MPAKSKAQQRFFGVVRGIQKGTGKGTGKAKKAARSMSAKDVDDFASTKHKGLPNKVKKETKVRNLIRKMVREIMKETFAGSLKKEDRKNFDNTRRKQSEVLGYKLTGKNDIRTEIGDATVKESTKEYGKSLNKIANDKKLKMISKKDRNTLKKLAKLMNEGKFPAGKHTFNTGVNFKGNGMTIYDRNQEERGDYKTIAHVAPSGKITIYDPKVKKSPTMMKGLNILSKSFIKEGKLTEKAKRDYKAEYKKYGSST